VDEPLPGGNTNAAVRRGDAVHRTAGPWSPTIHALLRHAADRGIDWAPTPLGFDEAGREVLTFLPGAVPTYPMPPGVWSTALRLQAGQLLRAFHDATTDFPLAGALWQQPVREPAEVVCHNDFAPYNFVVDEDRITGVIDFDMASPGPRAWDLAYLAYRLVPLAAPGDPEVPDLGPDERRSRLGDLAAAYDGPDPDRILELVPPRLAALAAYSDERAAVVPALAAHARKYRRDAAWAARNAVALLD
jgi:hypothetical protein